MKKGLLSLLAALCLSGTAYAIPAMPGFRTYVQSDGSTIELQQVGDEFNHSLVTRDGLTVARADDGNFYYRTIAGLSRVLVHEQAQRDASEQAFVLKQQEALTLQSLMTEDKKTLRANTFNATSSVPLAPCTGSPKIPVLLVNFKDIRFDHSKAEITEALLSGSKSVGQYFSDQSNGKYTPQFDVYGMYTLSNNRAYYGGSDSGGTDERPATMTQEACQMAIDVDFSQYDNNGDGYCDVVIIIYAGVGQAQSAVGQAVWPCQGTMTDYRSSGDGSGSFTLNGVTMDRFAVFNELNLDGSAGTIDGIGTFCHEFSHCLGLPDYYPTNNSSYYGMGTWSLMDFGCYNDNTFTPIGYGAYEKSFMGWIDLITPVGNTKYTLPVFNQGSEDTDHAVKVTYDASSGNEYYILEYRAKQGWDQYIKDEGVLVTHVTYLKDYWDYNEVNNYSTQLMTIVPADGTASDATETADLYGETNHELTNTSSPAATGQWGGTTGYFNKPITEIYLNSDGTASFWYMKGEGSTLSASPETVAFGDVAQGTTGARTITVRGTALQSDVTVTLNDASGVFSIDKATVTPAEASDGATVTVSFDAAVLGTYAATVTLSAPGVDDVTVNVTARAAIVKTIPVMQSADTTMVTPNSFTAQWSSVAAATSYTLQVNKVDTGDEPVETVYELQLSESFPYASENGTRPRSNIDGLCTNKGWTGSYVFEAPGGYRLGGNGYVGSLTTPPMDMSNSGGKMTVIATMKPYSTDTGVPVTVSCGDNSTSITVSADGVQTIILDCEAGPNQKVTFATTTASKRVVITQLDIYSSTSDAAAIRLSVPVESGDSISCLVTGIEETSYTVQGLKTGTYEYKVKALYYDGTESAWSNIQEVVLGEYGGQTHDYKLGDVNHDRSVDITDVTELIAYVLGNGNGICTICANVDGTGGIDIEDITALITRILGN